MGAGPARACVYKIAVFQCDFRPRGSAAMTLLSRKTDYALLILWQLHRVGSDNARQIAAQFGLSRPFVANILKELGHKGFVASHRGVKGGYTLLRPATDVTLAELLTALDDGFKLTVCTGHELAGAEPCGLTNTCPIRGPLSAIHHRLADVFQSVRLSDLFGSGLQPTLHTLPLRAAPRPALATV
jgi:Rrf2 family transcriptional regulator, cysteine metabolism repressor